MIIVSAADERFAPHFATMMHSVWSHDPHAEFHLLDCGLKLPTLCKLATFAADHGIQFSTISIDMVRFADLGMNKHMSAATYARIIIPELLPVPRVLYLDADTIALGSLRELWLANMDGAAIAGVADSLPPAWRAIENAGPSYINAGVLLLDLVEWRKGGVSLEVLTFLRNHPNLKLLDQTAINAVCRNRIKLIPPVWNILLGGHHIQNFPPGASARILHWAGMIKPWTYQDAPFAEAYLWHRRKTPFALAEPLRIHRPPWRRLLNLLVGRPKYWRRHLRDRRLARFIGGYATNDDITLLRDMPKVPLSVICKSAGRAPETGSPARIQRTWP